MFIKCIMTKSKKNLKRRKTLRGGLKRKNKRKTKKFLKKRSYGGRKLASIGHELLPPGAGSSFIQPKNPYI